MLCVWPSQVVVVACGLRLPIGWGWGWASGSGQVIAVGVVVCGVVCVLPIACPSLTVLYHMPHLRILLGYEQRVG